MGLEIRKILFQHYPKKLLNFVFVVGLIFLIEICSNKNLFFYLFIFSTMHSCQTKQH